LGGSSLFPRRRGCVRRFLTAALLAAGAILALTMAADAHSLVQFSDPPDGARLAHAPSAVLIMFTEAPDPKLSRVQILDTSGRQVAGGPVSPVRGARTTVAIALPPLGDGVYTVSWRTVSAIDGHVATGAFAFAVGAQPVPPIPLAIPPPAAPPSPLGVTGRWGLDAGYGLLLGGAWVDLLALQDFSLAVLLMVGGGDVLALIGALMVAEAARENAGVDWSLFLSTSLARGMELAVLPILAAGLAALAAWRLQGESSPGCARNLCRARRRRHAGQRGHEPRRREPARVANDSGPLVARDELRRVDRGAGSRAHRNPRPANS